MAQFTSKTALYSSTDPNGPDAGNGQISTEPISGFQLCGAGGVINGDIVERLGIQDRVEPFDKAAALEANDAKNRATYGTADTAGRVAGVEAAPAPVAPGPEPEAVKAESKPDVKPKK